MNSNNSTKLDTPLVGKVLAQAVSGGNNATINNYMALAEEENERERGQGAISAKGTQSDNITPRRSAVKGSDLFARTAWHSRPGS